jgi:hypothetical protein
LLEGLLRDFWILQIFRIIRFRGLKEDGALLGKDGSINIIDAQLTKESFDFGFSFKLRRLQRLFQKATSVVFGMLRFEYSYVSSQPIDLQHDSNRKNRAPKDRARMKRRAPPDHTTALVRTKDRQDLHLFNKSYQT